jgi:hypothetical protein
MALLPELDRGQLVQHVDLRRFKESFVAYLKQRKDARKWHVRALAVCVMSSMVSPMNC